MHKIQKKTTVFDDGTGFVLFYLDVKDILKILFKTINLFHSHENKTYDF